MKYSSGLAKSSLIIIISVSIALLGTAVWFLMKPREPKKPKVLNPGDYSYAVEYADFQIREAMKKHKIPGVIFSMVDGDDVIYSETYGYADAENKIETTADTIFKAGSISKVFTGIEVMRLQEDGLIGITDPLTDYLPEFQINTRFTDSSPITIDSIMTHRSGLPRGSTVILWDWSLRPLVLDAQMKSLRESHMVYPVGYRYKYSNTGYETLARMIESVRGLEPPSENTAGAFPYYMQEELFNPLGMTDTSCGSHDLMYGTPSSNPTAVGYYRKKGGNIPYNQFDIITMASGNVHTTLNDMTSFLSTLLTAGDEGIITQDLLNTMFYHEGNDSKDLKDNGLTWFRNSEILGETVVFHDGTNQGFISMLAMIPEHNIGIVIMANSDEFENVKSVISFDILRVMMETKTGKAIPDKADPEITSISEDIMMNYEGKFLMNDDIVEIIYKNGMLKAKYKGFKITLNPIGENTFTFKNPMIDSIESRFSFFPGNEFEEPYIILEMGDVFFCPRYPVPEPVPESWKKLEGKYNLYARHTSNYVESGSMGSNEIKIIKGILMMEDRFALLPVGNNRILIQGGVFHGETMEYDPDTGEITWQAYVYRPYQDD